MRRIALSLMIMLALALTAHAQREKQLVLLRHETVMQRYKPGSVIIYKLKHTQGYMTSLILDIQEFSIITSFDTIAFNEIERVSLKGSHHPTLTGLFGSFFMLGGIGYFAVDQLNSAVVHGNGYDNDPAVWKPALILVGGGLLLKQLHKRSLLLHYPVKLFATEPGKVFYQSEE